MKSPSTPTTKSVNKLDDSSGKTSKPGVLWAQATPDVSYSRWSSHPYMFFIMLLSCCSLCSLLSPSTVLIYNYDNYKSLFGTHGKSSGAGWWATKSYFSTTSTVAVSSHTATFVGSMVSCQFLIKLREIGVAVFSCLPLFCVVLFIFWLVWQNLWWLISSVFQVNWSIHRRTS